MNHKNSMLNTIKASNPDKVESQAYQKASVR